LYSPHAPSTACLTNTALNFVMNALKEGWFSELGSMWPGQCFSIEVDEVLFEGTSKFQDVVLFTSQVYGKVLVLDGVIQYTEKDEFAYQEMIAHLPLFAHPDPKKVLIIGGGDGGVLREVCKHSGVEKIDMCEIDELVVELSKEHFPDNYKALDDPRVELIIDDGVKFMETKEDEYDVIIVDSSDPVGPAEFLFEKPFYIKMKNALREGGIVCTQGECMWIHADIISRLISQSKQLFSTAEYAYTTIPTYPCGQIGFCICSKRDSSSSQPNREVDIEGLKYYTPELHKTSFVLPKFMADALNQNN